MEASLSVPLRWEVVRTLRASIWPQFRQIRVNQASDAQPWCPI